MKDKVIFYEYENDKVFEYFSKYPDFITQIESDNEWTKYQLTRNKDFLRDLREEECFSIINRGILWYNTLTETQRLELDVWYKEWLDITDKYYDGVDIESIIPVKPSWLK